MNASPSALIIDDERSIRRLLRLVLEPAGYRVLEAECGELGLQEAAAHRPDVVLLDLGLPDQPGLQVLARLREWSRVPVLIVSVRGDAEEKVQALDAGADDFIVKPFDSAELLARLRAIQRRAPDGPDEPVFVDGSLSIDFNRREVNLGGKSVELTATEYALLRCLVRHVGRVLSHRQLLREVWGPNAETRSNYLRVYMTHLRRKIEPPGSPKHIKTETGIGYRWMEPAPVPAPPAP